MSDDMSAYRDVFLSESAEYIQSIVDGLLALEENPGDLEPVETVFRGAHSLKGMAAAMGYDATTELTHRMETLMDTVRKGDQPADADLIDLVLRATDTVKDLIDAESSSTAPPPIEAMVDELMARAEGGPPASASGLGGDSVADEPAESAVTAVHAGGEPVYEVAVTLTEDCVLKSVRAYMVLKRLNYIGTVLDTVPSAQEIEDEAFDRDFKVMLQTAQSVEHVQEAAAHITDVETVTVTANAPQQAAPRAQRADTTAPKLSDTQTVRVSISHLDNLVNLVGELVTVRSRLDTIAAAVSDVVLVDAMEELHHVTGELQHEVMQTRMVPVGNIFNRFPRMVRDLARDLGKDVAFEMDGLDIELDRTVLDEIGDPIVHLLRNAVDHGVETPDARSAAGKDPKGRIRLLARRERDQVQVVVGDDGRGMDAEAIWAKAVEKGLRQDESRESHDDTDIFLLTCEPGFSTAEVATKVSGRGVGMDVVKGKIEYLGGSLTISSEAGAGCEFVLTLPLTLAIIQALLVTNRTGAFAIPLSAVSEVLARDEVQLDTVDGAPVVIVRDGEVVPVYHLDVLTGASADALRLPDPEEHLVLIETAGETRALTAAGSLGRHEIVIKPLSGMFKHLKGFGGATVLGDGSIALILDPRSFHEMGEGHA